MRLYHTLQLIVLLLFTRPAPGGLPAVLPTVPALRAAAGDRHPAWQSAITAQIEQADIGGPPDVTEGGMAGLRTHR